VARVAPARAGLLGASADIVSSPAATAAPTEYRNGPTSES
jgi:hypothetical protein